MTTALIHRLNADVVEFVGRCGDAKFQAVEIKIEGVESAYMMTLALPASTCRGLAGRVNPEAVYRAICRAINDSGVGIALP
ncbi:MAG TPA: hypothetical protein VJ797_15695 [Burkholderiales bacterium]|nr:hypothetical protein [Burkholderiales bacterium]